MTGPAGLVTWARLVRDRPETVAISLMAVIVPAVTRPRIAGRVVLVRAAHESVEMRCMQAAAGREVDHRGERRDDGDDRPHGTQYIEGSAGPSDDRTMANAGNARFRVYPQARLWAAEWAAAAHSIRRARPRNSNHEDPPDDPELRRDAARFRSGGLGSGRPAGGEEGFVRGGGLTAPIVWYFGAADPALALALADEHTSVEVIARDEKCRDACVVAVAAQAQLGRIQISLASDWADMAQWAPRVISAAVLDEASPGIDLAVG